MGNHSKLRLYEYPKDRKMNELLPHTKYLYIVRDPISRALSSLRMTIERGVKRGEEQLTIIDRWLSQQLNGGPTANTSQK